MWLCLSDVLSGVYTQNKKGQPTLQEIDNLLRRSRRFNRLNRQRTSPSASLVTASFCCCGQKVRCKITLKNQLRGWLANIGIGAEGGFAGGFRHCAGGEDVGSRMELGTRLDALKYQRIYICSVSSRVGEC